MMVWCPQLHIIKVFQTPVTLQLPVSRLDDLVDSLLGDAQLRGLCPVGHPAKVAVLDRVPLPVVFQIGHSCPDTALQIVQQRPFVNVGKAFILQRFDAGHPVGIVCVQWSVER